jgi:hypothetical protein
MPQKVNSGTEWRRILKSVVASHIKVLEELARVECSLLYVLDTMMQEHLSQQASQRGMQVDSWTSASTNFEISWILMRHLK